ncbi:hypothetical protein [Endozoicomonas lisbonensis]|uniref:ATP-binding protein n=1 Tax=Endozoicomonas lisbonensis TaxID=3120522 RepID=A0ABV2SPR4_9GAMM
MTTDTSSSFNSIIINAITKAVELSSGKSTKKHDQKQKIAGFCGVGGPTGTGKTSALTRSGDDGTSAALEYILKQGYQSVFVTHRWNILQDVYRAVAKRTDSQGNPFRASVIYAQVDTILAAFLKKTLPHEIGIQYEDLPDPEEELSVLEKEGLFIDEGLSEKIRIEYQGLISSTQYLEQIKKYNRNPNAVTEQRNLEEKIQWSCSQIEHLLLKNLYKLESLLKEFEKKSQTDDPITDEYRESVKKYRSNPLIRRIFPAIAWHDEQQHILIMTTHKLYSGFYDGVSKVRLAQGGLEGRVVFIDEFDYQADVLLDLLAESQLIQEPPQCLGQLLEEGRRVLCRLRYIKSPNVKTVYKNLSEILNELEEKLDEMGVDLRSLRALVVPLDNDDNPVSFKEQYLFRADHLVTSKSLTLRAQEHGYVVSERQPGPPSPEDIYIEDFLRVMETYLRKFTMLLTELSSSENDQAQSLVSRFSSILFDSVNDFKPAYYSSALARMSLKAPAKTNFAEITELAKDNILPNSHANIYGFSNWLLRENPDHADVDKLRLQIKRAFLPTTPEALLVSLASRNMVFGLSATSFIERAVGHFDIRWVRTALRYVGEARTKSLTNSFLGVQFNERPENWFSKPIPYVESESDIEFQQCSISTIKEAKQSLRQTQAEIVINKFNTLYQSEPFQELLESLPLDFFQRGNSELNEFTEKQRHQVLAKLLEVIQLASERSQHKGQLAFVNSIYFLRKWLTEQQAEYSWNQLSWLHKDQEFYNESNKMLEPLKGFESSFVPVICHNQPMILCLLTAQNQKQRGFDRAYQAAFNSGRIVLVITQNASATNGINLDFEHPELGCMMDLSCLYLIEGRHYFFSAYNSEDRDPMAHSGVQIRNLDKLRRSGELSREQHRYFLLPLMNNDSKLIQRLNRLYKQTNDYVGNIAADAQQQVGRIERVWGSVPEVEIHVSEPVAEVLARFAALPYAFENHRDQISDLNNQLLDYINNWAASQGGDFFEQLTAAVQDANTAQTIIDDYLIGRIKASRSPETKQEEVIEISKLWSSLGKAVLQMDLPWKRKCSELGLDGFGSISLYEWACIEYPENHISGQPIWYDPDTWQFFKTPDAGRIQYQPETLYQWIQKHTSIIDWFNKRGFRTSMYPPASELEERFSFHPLVSQRLLQGRLGEEAVRGLLEGHKIQTHAYLNHKQVLELYDFTVVDTVYRVDAKFYGLASLNMADDDYQLWIERGCDEDTAPLSLIKKLKAIRAAEGTEICLVIVNLVAQHADTRLLGFDQNLSPVNDVNEADIVVLGGCLTDDPLNRLTPGFGQLVNLLRKMSN